MRSMNHEVKNAIYMMPNNSDTCKICASMPNARNIHNIDLENMRDMKSIKTMQRARNVNNAAKNANVESSIRMCKHIKC